MNHIAAPLALGSKKRSFVTGSAALESTKPGTLTAPTSPLPRKMLATPQKRIHSGTENTLQRGRVLGNIRQAYGSNAPRRRDDPWNRAPEDPLARDEVIAVVAAGYAGDQAHGAQVMR